MVLHTFNKPRTVSDSLRFVAPGDQVLLIEDGVYALLTETSVCQHTHLCALDVDLQARGISVDEACTVISYGDFVTLCAEADQIKNWF